MKTIFLLLFSVSLFANDIKHITLLGTNDIHGSLEEEVHPKLGRLGSFAFFGGVVDSIRKGVAKKHGENGGVLLLDAGDQFQGTLLSNYSEGELVFKLMDLLKYDSVIPGNHDYDFGPQGWLDDKVNKENPDKNPRGAFEKIIKQVHFPLLSANTYLKSSIQTSKGQPISVESDRCAFSKDLGEIDWSKATRPNFLNPYLIKTIAGVRIAVIGMDNAKTSSMTTAENVSDLCFRNELETYLEIRNTLKDRADIFVLLIHSGDTNKETTVSELVTKINQKGQNVDAVIAGHTHFVNDLKVGNVPVIQSSANGQAFGRIDLSWDATEKRLLPEQTQKQGGILLFKEKCDFKAKTFCKELKGQIFYENVLVEESDSLRAEIQKARTAIAPLATKKLGVATATITKDRILESPLANRLTDSMRTLIGADLAILNSGGLRADLQKGDVTYEDLFRVLPFSNRAVRVGPMSKTKLLSLISNSIKSCGAFGPIVQSGLHVSFERNCEGPDVKNGIDPKARLLKVVVDATGKEINLDDATENAFEVATLDFIADGGDNFAEFKKLPLIEKYDIFREMLVKSLEKNPFLWDDSIDGRWKNQTP